MGSHQVAKYMPKGMRDSLRVSSGVCGAAVKSGLCIALQRCHMGALASASRTPQTCHGECDAIILDVVLRDANFIARYRDIKSNLDQALAPS